MLEWNLMGHLIGGLVGVGPVATVWEACATGLFIIVLLMAKSMFCELHALKIRNGTINNYVIVYVFGHE